MRCILRLKNERGESGPNLPDGVGFCEIACPGERSEGSFGLYETGYIEEEVLLQHGGQRVSEELGTLLRCASFYPPAMAVARKAIYSESAIHSVETFLRKYGRYLEAALANQQNDNFILARDITGRPNTFGQPGGFYWILSWDESDDTVEILDPSCADYYTYGFERRHFQVDIQKLRLLRR